MKHLAIDQQCQCPMVRTPTSARVRVILGLNMHRIVVERRKLLNSTLLAIVVTGPNRLDSLGDKNDNTRYGAIWGTDLQMRG